MPGEVTSLIGVVTGTAGGTVSVDIGGDVLTMQTLRGVACTTGDAVLVLRQAGAQWIAGALGAGTAPVPPPGEDEASTDGSSSSPRPPTPASKRRDSRPVSPVWTGTYRGGRWLTDRTDLMQGDWGWGRCFGAAFYADRVKVLPGVLQSVKVQLRRVEGGVSGGRAPTMCLLAQSTKPAGAPTILATATGPSLPVGGSATWTVPASWPPQLDSGAAGGIGIYTPADAPYIRLSAAGAAMTLDAEWEEVIP